MSMSTETLGKALILTPPDNEIMNDARQNILTQASALKLDFLPVMKEKNAATSNSVEACGQGLSR